MSGVAWSIAPKSGECCVSLLAQEPTEDLEELENVMTLFTLLVNLLNGPYIMR